MSHGLMGRPHECGCAFSRRHIGDHRYDVTVDPVDGSFQPRFAPAADGDLHPLRSQCGGGREAETVRRRRHRGLTILDAQVYEIALLRPDGHPLRERARLLQSDAFE